MTTTYTLAVGDVSRFKVGVAYRTSVGSALDTGRFTVTNVLPAARRIIVQTSDGWVPVNGRAITFDTDSLLPGDSFTLEAIALRMGLKTGMDKLPTNRRIEYGVSPNPCPECTTYPAPGPLPVARRALTPVVLTSGLHGTQGQNANDLMVQVINEMIAKGFATVNRSCDAITTSTSNLWTDYTKVRGASGGGGGAAGSWIVFDLSGWPGAQLMINCTVTSAWSEMNYWISPKAKFTGGSTAVKPTATDQIQFQPAQWMGTGPNANSQFYATCWASSDNSYFRIGWWYAGNCISFWQFDKLANTPSPWTTPWFSTFMITGANAAAPNNRYTLPLFCLLFGSGGRYKPVTFPSGVLGSLQGTAECQQAGGINYINRVTPLANEATGQHGWSSPAGMIISAGAAGTNGIWGYLTDQWWTEPFANDGDTFGDNKECIAIGDSFYVWGLPTVPLGGVSTNYATSLFYGRNVS